MPENENAIGEYWTKESVAILSQFGWEQLGSCNFDIDCSCHSQRKVKRHGIDSLFSYYDPYLKSDLCILVESKNWKFENFKTSKIKDMFKQITDCMECMQVSPVIQDLTSAPIKNALLMCWCSDTYDRNDFMEQLNKVRVNSKKV